MSHFKYSGLHPLEIRLLELQPGSPEDPLTGTILQRELVPENHKIPDYEALSYCWGDQSHPEIISLTTEHQSKSPAKSGYLNIGPNLASALRALRYRDRSRVIWCDSICINQRNLAERSSQVQRMQDVYRWAKKVVVWLGPATSWSHSIMETLRELANKLPHTIDISGNCHRLDHIYGLAMTSAWALPVTHDRVLAFEKLLAIDWHRRLWTLQEVAFANRETSIVRIGNEEMSWNRFKNVVVFTGMHYWNSKHHYFFDPAIFIKNIEIFIIKANINIVVDRGDVTEWVNLLHLISRYDCSDDRDRLYSIRGFLKPDVALSIAVDYTKSAKQILSSACISHITRNRNMRFLELCNSATLPTWTPDVGKRLDMLNLSSSASGTSAASSFPVQSDVLQVAGRSCDEICNTPINFPRTDLLQPSVEYMASIIRVLRCLTGSEHFYNDDECLDELITMLTLGVLWDYDILRTKSRPEGLLISLENGRDFIRQFITHNIHDSGFVNKLIDTSKIPACTRTRNGTLVRVPIESRNGDIIVTLLGLQCNLVLRRQRQSGYFKVIGPCYHPGMSHGQALLGDNFDGWKRLWSDNAQSIVFWKEGQHVRLSDPRLDGVQLPEGYTRHKFSIGNDGEERQRWFHNGPVTKSMVNESIYDPRMSEEELKKRGVPIETFRLI
ncbi:hypothetical protein FSHL1_010160 [Fusarium sambucinum]